jgi:hypothetical protein
MYQILGQRADTKVDALLHGSRGETAPRASKNAMRREISLAFFFLM